MLNFICLLLLIGQGGTESVYYEGSGDHRNGSAVDSSILSCPGPWSVFENTNGSTGCACGNPLEGIVHCDISSHYIQLRPCYCMTPYAKDPNITVVGACLSTCFGHYHYVPKNITVDELSYYVCITQNRHTKIKLRHQDGQLCGKCIEGFAPPVYAYHQRCVNCSHNEYIENSVKYCIIAFLPLTVFFIVLVTLRISATSPSLNAFVLACQVLTSPLQVELILVHLSNMDTKSLLTLTELIISLTSFWNLDFFRTLYPGLCLHPNMSTLQILALDYIIAAHPLFLIAVTYTLVELHDHNCKIVVLLWKPFLRCFARFRRQWDIRTSLIEAFATFLLLSYVKFLSVSLRFLLPVYVYNVHGESMEPYLYYDGTIEYLRKQHLPYAILAIVVLIIFNILPLLLLCLYPCHCFQRILNICRLRCQALHTFMDAFQGCYKNGTNGTRDCRHFSAVYLFVRIIFLVIAAVSLGYSVVTFYFLTGVLFSLLAILIAITQPYKSSIYNNIDTVLILAVALFHFFAMGRRLAHSEYHVLHSLTGIMQLAFSLIPLVYIFIVIVNFFRSKTPPQWCSNLPNLPFCKWLMERSAEEPLPERLSNPEECAALLHEPVSDDQDSNGPPDHDEPSFEQQFL